MWLVILTVDLFLHWHKHRLAVHEIPNRIRLLAERLKTVAALAQESKYPWCTQSAASDGSILFRVWRDGRLVLVPCNLMWKGDLVELARGDAAPCQVCREKQVFPMDSPIQVSGRYTVDCEDDQHPLYLQLRTALQNNAGSHLLFIDLLALFAPVLLPLPGACLFVALPLLLFVRAVFETARISLLADQLKQSRIPYADDEFDEFDDEAPPPTKDIHLPTVDVLKRAWNIAAGPTSNTSNNLVLDWLVWQKDLTHMLSSVSVMAFLDREGPIASPFPRPIEVIIPVADSAELASAEILPDVNNPSRVVIGFSDAVLKSKEQLKAIGLACLLCSDCMQRGAAHRKDWHKRKTSCLNRPSSLHPSLQTCLCPVARAIGFADAAAKGFTFFHEHWQSASDSSWIVAQFFSGTVKTGTDFSHVFCFGDLRAVLDASSEAWNTHSIVPISESLRWKLRDLWQDFVLADIDTLAFAYLPVKESARNEYVFLGAIAIAFDPREDMQEFIDDLGQAGIRFVYFSPYSERVSKAFGERLGLETDWNSCILLSTAPHETGMPAISARVTRSHGYSALSDIKARLPRGPANIRQHLLSVDDIPLHVSIFAECRSEPGLIEAMLGIYGEWHETVAVIGSLVADKTVESASIFAMADVAIGMLPGQLDEAALLGACFFGASCSFFLPFESSPYVLTELIREARTLFLIRSQHVELFSYLVVLATSSPWSIPAALCLACSFYASPYDPNIMKSIAQRQPNHTRTIFWMLVKLVPVAIGAFFADPFSVPLLLVLSAGMVVPREAIRANYFFFALSIGIVLISAAFGHTLTLLLHSAVFGFPIVSTHFLIGHHLSHQRDEEQKRAKLEFNTKLGMHSPV